MALNTMNATAIIQFATPQSEPFDWIATRKEFFYGENGWQQIFIYGAILYCPVVFILKQVMSYLSPVPSSIIKPILLLWNIWMTLFSLAGAYYLIPILVAELGNKNWSVPGQVCDRSCWTYPGAVWAFIFNVTKMMEWIDTLFLLVQKKPVIFLHWFHHIVTMLYCWHATMFSVDTDCSGMWFAAMNLVVHTIMYGYYGLRSLYSMRGKRFKLFSPLYITILQILQMVVGMSITATAYVRCEETQKNNVPGVMFAFVMYAIYFYLFSQLFTAKKSQSKKGSSKKSQ